MVPIAIPKDMKKSNTAVLLDFERTFTKHNLLVDISLMNPLMATKSLLEGFKYYSTEVIKKKSSRGMRFTLTCGVKKSYCSKLTDEQKRILGASVYQIDRREGTEDLLYILNQDGWDYTIVTSCDKTIAEGFFNKFVQSKNIIGTNGDDVIWAHQKGELAKEKKRHKKYLICVGDCEIDAEMCMNADISFKIGSISSFLFGGYKLYGYNVKNLYKVKSFFDFIHYKNLLTNKSHTKM